MNTLYYGDNLKILREYITHLSIALQKYRLKDAFGLEPVGTRTPSSASGASGRADDGVRVPQYRIIGEPEDLDGEGADRGIDGTITFIDDNTAKAKRVIVSVKSGHVNVAQIRDLGHVIDREQAAIGVFPTLEPPSKPMTTEALEKGFYHSPGWNRDYPRLQILTIEDLLGGKQVDMPPSSVTFKQAEKLTSNDSDQISLTFE